MAATNPKHSPSHEVGVVSVQIPSNGTALQTAHALGRRLSWPPLDEAATFEVPALPHVRVLARLAAYSPYANDFLALVTM